MYLKALGTKSLKTTEHIFILIQIPFQFSHSQLGFES